MTGDPATGGSCGDPATGGSCGDPATLDFYQDNAGRYADWSQGHAVPKTLEHFAASLPAGAAVADLGCGAGWASAWLQGQGFSVTAFDPVPAMVELTASRGVTAILGGAEALPRAAFDGLWCNAALQHIPRDGLPAALAWIAAALRPGGRLFLSVHEGDGTLRDGLGRLYNHHREPDLREALTACGLATLAVSRGSGQGFDGRPITMLRLDASREA
ncbi:methyltransferase domain-containing protein [Frigidibacter albus]|uniref:Methyltransferase domain-containing protein n=1 Tax=Frigidibacter albus TaxID=1465486 RepID=A0A6L8VE18_9RHOB|nr:class I SAM-dependent methyltransferase [Frigidibacter albus]MZQ87936.1 methyltransferase domain-containing protein [Frigidibacter albus]NBE29842.1 methyltransferase domain-containing protein [Frigidibacter albus]GGH42432.1 SAM-dependent methyltransferase [Frigidibacter albus]